MAIIRHATAHWNGAGKTGAGRLSTQSGVLQDTTYDFVRRFGAEPGTNPEELLAAAHAGCFSMKLAFVLNAAGHTADSIETKAAVVLDPAVGAITKVELTTRVRVEGVSAEQFAAFAADAKANCPVSKLFNAEITLDAGLVSL